MRKNPILFYSLVGLSSLVLVAAAPETIDLPANFDAWNLNFKYPIEKLQVPENAPAALSWLPNPPKCA